MDDLDLLKPKNFNFSIRKLDYTKLEKKNNRLKVYNRQYYLNKKADSNYYNKYLNYYKINRDWIKKYKCNKKSKLPTQYEIERGTYKIDFS